MGVLEDNMGALAAGALITVELTVLAFAGALGLGAVLAVLRACPIALLRWLSAAYVAVFRNIPLLVLLVLMIFGLPEIGLLYPLFGTIAAGLGLYSAAFACEIIRSGLRAVPSGQAEAARACGFTGVQTLRLIVLPQALRAMIQPLGTMLIGIVLNTSIAGALGVAELTGATQFLNIRYAEPLVTFGAATAIYLLLTVSAGLITGRLARRLAVLR